MKIGLLFAGGLALLILISGIRIICIMRKIKIDS